MNVPMGWIQASLMALGAFGVLIGALSAVSPRRSIKLYQWIMKNFNWRVEPIDYAREVRNTRALGLWLLIMSGLMFVVLLKPELITTGGLLG